MDPVLFAEIGGQILGIGAAAFGEWWNKADREKRDALLEQAQRLYDDLSPPELQALRAEQTGPSAFESIQVDPANREARNRAIRQLMEIGEQGGMDAGSMLALEQGRRAAAAQEQQGRAAVRQEFARRGLGGAGEAALQQQAQQAAAGNAALGALQAGSDARARALQALQVGGGMAQTATSSDYQQEAARAAAMDRIAEFNARVRQDTNQFNAGQVQQGWNNRLALTDRMYGATRDRAGAYETEAERKRRIAGGVGQTFASTGGNLADYYGKGRGKP